MKYTLLDMVQTVLSSMDGQEVNSIGDTTESTQVAYIVRTAYYNILSRSNLPEHFQLFNLTASGDNTEPVVMYRPDNVLQLDWIKYDKSDPVVANEPDYEYVTIVPLAQFLDLVNKFNPEEADVSSMTLNGNIFYFKNDKHPTYCTIIEDNILVFDSYDAAVDTTLQSSKTLCFGKISPEFLLEDNFIPSLDDTQFALLLNEVKSLAFLEMKQIAHDKAIFESRKQWQSLQHSKYLNSPKPFDQFPDFGRRTVRSRGIKC